MSDSPLARAKARREAILSRGTNRLAKLTGSARGEEAAAEVYREDALRRSSTPTTNLKDLVGEETRQMPTPPPMHPSVEQFLSTSSREDSGTVTPDPSAWNAEQQQQFMQAIMGGGPPNASGTGMGPPPGLGGFPNLMNMNMNATSETDSDDPLSAIFSQLTAGLSAGLTGSNTTAAPAKPTKPVKPKSLFQRLLPLFHVVSTLMLLFYFIVHIEPVKHADSLRSRAFDPYADGENRRWMRWAQLAKRPQEEWGVQIVPIFWTFTILQLSLHSLRLFSESREPLQLPTLLSFAMPHLPPPVPSLIINGMKYWKMCSMVLDDLSVLVFAVGVVVWASGWAV